VIVLAPKGARAHEITFVTSVDEPGGFPTLSFGTDPASGHLSFLDVLVDGHLIRTSDSSDSGVSGGIAFFTGPLLSLVCDSSLTPGVSDPCDPEEITFPFFNTEYRYAPGQLSFTGHWTLSDGSMATGSFLAPLLDLTIQVREGDCSSGFACGDFTATLGPGLFDVPLALVLGVPHRSSGGMFSGSLDFVDGDPLSQSRFSGAPSPWDVKITTPEPSLSALLLIAAAAIWRHRGKPRHGRP
jgi:hypothetical protein